MDRRSFLWSLDQALTGLVPNREREEMIRYYEEYFDEAGPEGEASVIESLGDPRELARRLAVEAGFSGEKPARKKRRVWPWVLLAVVVVFALLIGWLMMNLVYLPGGKVPGGEVSSSTTVLQGDVIRQEEQVEAFRSVDVEVPLADVDVTFGESYQVKLVWDEDSGYSLKYTISGGTLKVTASHKSLDSLTVEGAQVIIVVPEGAELERVSVESGMGDIRLLGVKIRNAECETGLGDIVLAAQISGQASADTGLGDVAWVGMPLIGEVELSTGMGDISIGTDSIDGFDVQLSTGMGDITVNGTEEGNSYHQRGKQGELEASSGMGNIVLEYSGS